MLLPAASSPDRGSSDGPGPGLGILASLNETGDGIGGLSKLLRVSTDNCRPWWVWMDRMVYRSGCAGDRDVHKGSRWVRCLPAVSAIAPAHSVAIPAKRGGAAAWFGGLPHSSRRLYLVEMDLSIHPSHVHYRGAWTGSKAVVQFTPACMGPFLPPASNTVGGEGLSPATKKTKLDPIALSRSASPPVGYRFDSILALAALAHIHHT